ncbi:6-carboxytetrahydropterin synthase QueD [bacterium]|nr:MAG: 6-carboxytetrahydropterin synthase QueD [bacterium]
MYLIRVKGEFSAAHRIEGYDGDCANIHGHNWRVEAVIRAEELDDLGLACDFRRAKDILGEVLQKFDHKDLNEHPWLDGGNPTSERIAKIIFERIEKLLSEELSLESVEVFESDMASVIYIP